MTELGPIVEDSGKKDRYGVKINRCEKGVRVWCSVKCPVVQLLKAGVPLAQRCLDVESISSQPVEPVFEDVSKKNWVGLENRPNTRPISAFESSLER